ncbi:MAG: 4Fe-4S binding protein, partial [Clostridia bacterium]
MASNSQKTQLSVKSHKMFNNKITITRLIILGAFFLLFSYGGFFLGSNTNIILPIFNCEYVGGGTTRGVCIAIIDFNKRISFSFLFSMAMWVVSMIVIGRLWCGYVCPMGFIQDVMTIVRQKLRVPQLSFPQEIKPFLTIVKWYCVFYILFNDLCKVCPI